MLVNVFFIQFNVPIGISLYKTLISSVAGGYATKPFRDVRHSQYAVNLLKRFQIGVLDEVRGTILNIRNIENDLF